MRQAEKNNQEWLIFEAEYGMVGNMKCKDGDSSTCETFRENNSSCELFMGSLYEHHS
ncbi:MAG: hypothetical protein II838_10220 [Lachnospiraceae bacterium]|nr:hypothetical protein [Lachnospiraceae bacterium]